jgi:hypothetical protein
MQGFLLALRRLKRWERRCRPRAFMQLVYLICAFGLGSFLKENECGGALDETAYYEDRYNQQQSKLLENVNLLANIQLELKIAKQAQQKIENSLQLEINKRSKLLQEISFFRSVLSPESSKLGVHINEFKLQPNLVPNSFRYSLLLSQINKRHDAISGTYDIILTGLQRNERVEYKLTDMVNKPSNFMFRYFQELVGTFDLPEQFIVKRVMIKVKIPKNRWRKAQEQVQEWSLKEVLQPN